MIKPTKLKPTFNVIDVETANRDYSSICQIGIVYVTEGEITKEWQTLIDPQDEFDPWNTSVHGITEDDVKGARTLPEIRQKLGHRLHDQILVSHTHFDRIALDCAMERYDLPKLRVTWLDSCKIARYAWPHLESHGLKQIASYLGISFDHHNALEDARMAAKLVLQAHIETNRDTFLDLGPTAGKKRPAIIEEPPFEPNLKLEGEKIVFTGKLPVSRNSAQNMVIQSGGSVVKSVTKKTTILVCGKQDKDSLKGKTISNKHLKVRERIRTGQKIEVLSGEDFLGLFYGQEEIPKLGYGTGDLERDTRFEMYLDSRRTLEMDASP